MSTESLSSVGCGGGGLRFGVGCRLRAQQLGYDRRIGLDGVQCLAGQSAHREHQLQFRDAARDEHARQVVAAWQDVAVVVVTQPRHRHAAALRKGLSWR